MFFSKKHIARSQRGAMFGLDARVALAIFGGLSVIAGAAVYSSVRETSVTSLLAEFDGISKAYINYTFDTGVDIPLTPEATGGFQNLYTNRATVLGAKPPYITRQTDDHPTYGSYSLVRAQIALNDTESAWYGDSETVCTQNTTTIVCGAWLQLTDVPCEIAKDLERRLDGESGAANTGNLRIPNNCDDGTRGTVSFLLSRMMG